MNKLILIFLFVFCSNAYSQEIISGFPLTIDTADGSSGTAASPIVVDFDKDGNNEILCGVCLELFNGKIFLISQTGQIKPGWPKTIYGIFNYVNTAAGDLNKDGFIDIIVRAGDSVYAYNYTGNYLPGFPVYFGNQTTYSSDDYLGLYDINNDGYFEIITQNKNRIGVINRFGQFLAGFPKVISLGSNTSFPMFTLMDLDDDGKGEIIIPATNFTTYADSNSIIILRYNGQHYPNSPINSDSTYYFSFANSAGFKDILTGQKMFLICSNFSTEYNPYTYKHRINLYNNNCQLISRGYIFNSLWEFNELSVGNIDPDEHLEGFCTNIEFIFGFKQNGIPVNGFPVSAPNAGSNKGVVIGKLSNTYNVVAALGMADKNSKDSVKGYIKVFKVNGLEESWSPLRPKGIITYVPTICDLNNDGQTDLVAVSSYYHYHYSTIVYAWTFPGVQYDKFDIKWNMGGHDRCRTNQYGYIPIDEPVNINTNQTIVNDYNLYQNYPNPFNSSTRIKFDIKKDRFVHLSLYDISGRKIVTLVNQNLKSGSYEMVWNAYDIPSGIYFCKLSSDEYSNVIRLVVIK